MRKNINKLATLVMTGALAASMSFSALAATVPGTETTEGDDTTGSAAVVVEHENANIDAGKKANNNKDLDLVGSGETMTIVKKIKTDGKTYAPNGTFSFEVKEATPDSNGKEKDFAYSYDDNGTTKTGTKTFEIKAGVKEGVTVQSDAVFTQDNVLNSEYTAVFKVKADLQKFTNAGVYMYTLKEKNGYNGNNATTDPKYPGMVYDGTTYTMYVFITNTLDASGNVTGRAVSNVVLMKGDEKVNALVNYYGVNDPDTPDVNEDELYNLTISKVITGTMGSQGDTFHITLNVDSDVAGGESFNVIKKVNGDVDSSFELKSGTSSGSLDISKTITYEIVGLSAGDVVSVNEAEAGLDSYVTTVGLTNATEITANGYTSIEDTLESTETMKVKVSDVSKDAALVITNKRDAVTPTGVAMDIAPYALMVALAGGAAATFLRKKESFED